MLAAALRKSAPNSQESTTRPIAMTTTAGPLEHEDDLREYTIYENTRRRTVKATTILVRTIPVALGPGVADDWAGSWPHNESAVWRLDTKTWDKTRLRNVDRTTGTIAEGLGQLCQ